MCNLQLIQMMLASPVLLFLISCGGGDNTTAPPRPTEPTLYRVGGSVAGLEQGKSLVFLNNGVNALTVGTNGAFALATSQPKGTSYSITVGTQPAGQTCVVSNGVGTVDGTAVTSVSILCKTHFAYVPNSGDHSVSQLKVNANGTLMLVSTLMMKTEDYPTGFVLDPTGNFAYVGNEGSNTLAQYSVGENGNLSVAPVATIQGMFSPKNIVFSPSGKTAYVVHNTSIQGAISQFTVGTNGNLVPHTVPTVTTGGYANKILFDATGKFAYIANQNESTVSIYAIEADGNLSFIGLVDEKTFVIESMALDPAGKNLYIVNGNINSIVQYSIGTDGRLTFVDRLPETLDMYLTDIAFHPSGKYAYVTNIAGNGSVREYEIGTNGIIARNLVKIYATESGPREITIDPIGKYIYVANAYAGSISQFVIEPNGDLTAMTPAVVKVGANPRQLFWNFK